MLEAIFHPADVPFVSLQDSPIPAPPPAYLLIKVNVASSNPKDWLHPTALKRSLNSGDDLAGVITAVGSDVSMSFKVGDRVAAFHPMMSPHGAYAEYALAPAATTFHVPASMSFEEASTISLVTATAAVTLFQRQHFPTPWSKSARLTTPLIIYGASSSLGACAVKLAKLANIHPIIAIAGSGASYVSQFLDVAAGDILLDYRVGTSELMAQVASHLASLGNLKAHHAFDCISAKNSWVPISHMLDPSPPPGVRNVLSVTSGSQKYNSPDVAAGVEIIYTYVGSVHSGSYLPQMPNQPLKEEVEADPDFAINLFQWLEGATQRQEYEGQPYEVMPGGLGGVEEGLRRLRMGETGGKKMIYRIEETESISAS